jgi:hypothetical protein
LKGRRIVVIRYRRITVMLDGEPSTDVDLDPSEENDECCKASDCSLKQKVPRMNGFAVLNCNATELIEGIKHQTRQVSYRDESG